MTTFSRVHTVKSNARRSARKEGIDPSLVVACPGGFHYPLPEPEAAEPARWFKSYRAADNAAKTQAKRSGLKDSAFKIVVSYRVGKPEFGYVAAHAISKYDLTTGKEAPQAKSTTKEETKARALPAREKKTAAKPGLGQDKLATVLTLITRPNGATMPEIIEATGWLPHTARARISGLVEQHKLSIKRERLLGVTTYSAMHPYDGMPREPRTKHEPNSQD